MCVKLDQKKIGVTTGVFGNNYFGFAVIDDYSI